MTDNEIQSYIWGEFPENEKEKIISAVKNSLPKYHKWQAFQRSIGDELEKTHRIVRRDVQLDNLRVDDSYAEIDYCLESSEQSGILVHLSGRQAARHEKELLEIISVIIAYQVFKYGVLITLSDNKLKSQGSRGSSFAYCVGPLLKLISPILNNCPIRGLLIIGYKTPVDEVLLPKD